MPVFIRLIRFTDAGLDACGRQTAEVVAKTLGAVKAAGAKVLGAYVSLGAYDVVSIMEARDEDHVAEVDKALASLGYYLVVDQAGAVPLNEFVDLSKQSPMFVSAWLQGRRALNVDRRPPATPSAEKRARAASTPRSRSKNVDERRAKREPGGGAFVAWFGAEGPFEVKDYTIESADASLTFALTLPDDSAVVAELIEVERNAEVKNVAFGIVADKSRTAIKCTLLRMDLGTDGYHAVVVRGILPRAAFDRVEKRMSSRVARK